MGKFGGEHDEVVVENLNKELQIMVPGTHERRIKNPLNCRKNRENLKKIQKKYLPFAESLLY